MTETTVKYLLSSESLRFERQRQPLFTGLGVTLMEGGVLLVVGRNGSGKSTLLKCLAGLIPVKGKVIRPQNLLYLGHADGIKLNASVEANVRFWAELSGEPMLTPAAMEYFGLNYYLDMPCHMLSAGWRKRVALARLLTNPAALWLLDEPYSHLDEEGVRLLGGLIESRVRKGGAVIMAVHHLPPGALGELGSVAVLQLEDFKERSGADVSDAA